MILVRLERDCAVVVRMWFRSETWRTSVGRINRGSKDEMVLYRGLWRSVHDGSLRDDLVNGVF